MALFTGAGQALLEAEEAAPGSVLDRDSSRHCRRLRGRYAAALARALLGRRRGGTAACRARRSTDRPRDRGRRADHRLLGDGPDPAQELGRRPSARSSTSCCCAATSAGPAPASARCAATATCRATARWASGRSFSRPSSTRSGGSSASLRRGEHGYDTVEAIRAMRDGRGRRSSSPWAATSSRATPDTEVTEAALRRCRADRAGVDQAQPLPPRHRRRGADPAQPGPHRAGPAGGREQFVTRRGLDEHGPPLARPPGAGRRALLSEVAIVCRLAERTLGAGPRSTGQGWSPTTTAIRDHIARVVPGFDDYNAGSAARRLPAAARARDARTFPTATGKASFTVNPLEAPAPGRAACSCRRSAPTTSTTPPSTASTTATAASTPAAAWSWSTRTTCADRGLADGAMVDLVSEWPDGVSGGRRGFRVVAYPTAARLRRRLLPRDQRAGPARTPRPRSATRRPPSRSWSAWSGRVGHPRALRRGGGAGAGPLLSGALNRSGEGSDPG